PASMRVLSACQPIYEELDGWKEDILYAKEMSELPTNARKYLKRLEELAEAKIVLVSVGAGREETIILEDPFHN
ncbi:MAG TPA: adenylosuccinate synthetase, partial [Smithellaceae bacterium]